MMAAHNKDEIGARRQYVETLREEDLLELIRETVAQLNNLGDRLEAHVKRKRPSMEDKDESSAG